MTPVSRSTLEVRQHQLLAPSLRDIGALVFGAGMLGSWTVLSLARMLKRVDVWDYDRVSEENLGTQAYTQAHLVDYSGDDDEFREDIGMLKAQALEDLCYGLPVHGHPTKAPPDLNKEYLASSWPGRCLDLSTSVVVCCVDSIAARRECAEWAEANDVPLFIDTRALGELAVIYPVARLQPTTINGKVAQPVTPNENYNYYLADLPDESSVPDAPCGGVGTAYVGHWVSSQVARLINNWAQGQQLPGKVVHHVGQDTRIIQPETG